MNFWLETCASFFSSPGIPALYEFENQVQVQVGVSSVLPGGCELQVQVQVQVGVSSVLPGGPAVHVVELSNGGQLPPREVVDPDGHN